MSTYAIGDLQGCYRSFMALLDAIAYSPNKDALWFCGDIVSRGPDSLACLRWLYAHQDRVTMVLGNHDLSLLAYWALGEKSPARLPDCDPLLAANDADDLLNWLRNQPLLHHSKSFEVTLVHAGIWPYWTLNEAKGYAQEVGQRLRAPDWTTLLESMYGDDPRAWNDNLRNGNRYRFMINVFTRMRMLTTQRELSLAYKGDLADKPSDHIAWFDAPNRISDTKIVFGHWAALRGEHTPDDVVALDTGCVWGGELTAYRLDDGQTFSVSSLDKAQSHHG